MKLQYQLSNGNWADCETKDQNRTEEFLLRCQKFSSWNPRLNELGGYDPSAVPTTREQVIAQLNMGKTVRNDRDDWYSNCRDAEVVERIHAEKLANQPKIEMVKCSCGHTVPRSQVMSASLGTSCPNCYDRLSD